MTEYRTNCKDLGDRKGCGKEIIIKMGDDNKNHPYNSDGSLHRHFGTETKTKPLATEVKNIMQLNEQWVRDIAADECGKILAKHGIGFKSE